MRHPRIVIAACLLASFTQAQDLGALARKEKERRAKIAKPVKVLTEEDGKAAATSAVTVIEPSSATAAPVSTEAVTPATDEKAIWKSRADAMRFAVANAQEALDAIERQINEARADLAPLSATDAQDPLRTQKRDQRIAQLAKAADEQRKVVATAKKALQDFEDEARRNGIPAGWLR